LAAKAALLLKKAGAHKIDLCVHIELTFAMHLLLSHIGASRCLHLQVALSRYKRWSTPPRTKPTQSKRPRQELLDQQLMPDFKNGRKLRDYQVRWL
jgi:hypothetical protein